MLGFGIWDFVIDSWLLVVQPSGGMKTKGAGDLHAALRLTYLATFLFGTAGGLFLLLPLYLHQIGSSPAQIGFVVGLLRISSLVARPLGGHLLDRLGRRPAIGLGTGLLLLGILSFFVVPRIDPIFLLMRVLQGAGTALVDSGLGAVLADLAPPAARAQIFALFSLWITVPNAIMPAAGEALTRHAGFAPLFAVAALVVLASLLAVQRLPETRHPSPAPSVPVALLLRRAFPIVLGASIVGFVFGVISTFVPVADLAEAPGRVGLFFFAYFLGLIGMRVAGALGWSQISMPWILLPAYGAMAAALLILPFGHWLVLLVAVGLVCGAGHGSVIPVLYTVLLVSAPKDQRGMSVALLAAGFDFGVIAAAMGLGVIAEWVGYRGVFALGGLIVIGAGMLANRIWKK